MTKSATDVMQEIIFSAVLDSIAALKASSKGLPNNLLRDLNAIHATTTLADTPEELQAAISASVRAAFTRLLKEGYSVSPGKPAPSAPRHAPGVPVERGGRPPRGGGPRGPTGPGVPRGGDRPPRTSEGERRPRGGRPGGGGGRPGGGGGRGPGGGRPGGSGPGGGRPSGG